MLHVIGGGSEHSAAEFYGRRIVAARMVDATKASDERHDGADGLILTFADGCVIRIWDNGQSCCENRYMTTDDDLNKIVGGVLTRIDVKEGDAPKNDEEYGEHEIAFLEIGTDECFVTVATHNEHNGYYGGFALTITIE